MNQTHIPSSQTDFPLPKINYLKCPSPTHSHMDLKFLLQSELPQIKNLYCSLCIEERLSSHLTQRHEIIPLDQIIQEIVLLSGRYTSQLDPLISDVQRKYKEIAEKDFQNMFEEFTIRSEDFKKTLDTFQNRISILCANFEQLFQKRLETLICESLVSVDARLCSFKKTFEILRFKLKSYTSELATYLRGDQEVGEYCGNINLILKDLEALKNSNLSDQINRIVEGVSLTSPIAEKFEAGCNFDEELCRVIDGIVILLNKKVKTMQYELNTAKMKLNSGYQPPREKPSEKKESKEDIRESPVVENRKEEVEEVEEVEIRDSPTIESKKSSLMEPLLGDDVEYRYSKAQEEGNERKCDEKVVNEEKKVERKEEKVASGNNVGKVREEENSKNVKQNKSEKTKNLKREESEDLKRFAVSLLLKGERNSKGGEMVSNGGYIISEEGKTMNEDCSEISLTREMRKQNRVSMGIDHPRISKKIVKPKKRSAQGEREMDRKIGKHISPDIQKRRNARIRWRDREASDSESPKSSELAGGDKIWAQPEDNVEKPLLLFDKEKGGT